MFFFKELGMNVLNIIIMKPLNQNKMEVIILIIVIFGFVLDRLDASSIIKNQGQILKKIEEINKKLKSE